MSENTLKPPAAKIAAKTMTLFGDTRTDNYFWLRDRADPDTIAYLEAENAYLREVMKPTEELQKQLYEEMLGRIQQTDASAPAKREDYLYYTRTEEGKQYQIHCRKKFSVNADEEILLDGNALAEGKKYFRVGNFVPSPDHSLLAYSIDFEGNEVYVIYIKDLRTGALLSDQIPNTYYSLEWTNDGRAFYYVTLDDAKRPFKAHRHVLGESSDTLIHHESDERFTVEVSKTSSRAYILIEIHSSLTSEIRYANATDAQAEFQHVLPRVFRTEYDLTHHGESFYIRTNDGAQGFRLVEAPVANPKEWVEKIGGRSEVTIESVLAFRDFLVIEERDRGLTKLRIERWSDGATHYVAFDEPAYRAGLGANAEFETNWLRFVYTSLVTPESAFDYNMETRERNLVKQQPVLGGFDASHYRTERLQTRTDDGVDVPISVVYRKGFVRDGKAPMLLYGYGSYGISIDAAFRSDRLSLLDRGFVYAIAHIRGGGDLGKPWHEAGRMLTKKKTFSDFIACAEHVIHQRYTSADRLAIMGGSAGGMLMGAVTNLRPDLFAAVLALVPFVDTLTTELDSSLPLTVGEWEEWGNPAERDYYDYIKSYSPYDNVAAREYPAMLVTAGWNDPRVSYWEPAKYVAKLRALKRDQRTLLLKTNMGSGHFGASGRYDYLKETAFHFAFLLGRLPSPGLDRLAGPLE